MSYFSNDFFKVKLYAFKRIKKWPKIILHENVANFKKLNI